MVPRETAAASARASLAAAQLTVMPKGAARHDWGWYEQIARSSAPTTLSQDDGGWRPGSRPIIDMHMHAYPPDIFGPPGPNPISGVGSTELTEAEIRQLTLEEMDRHNIVLAVLSGPLDVVGRWKKEVSNRILASPHFPRFSPFLELDSLRQLYTSRQLEAWRKLHLSTQEWHLTTSVSGHTSSSRARTRHPSGDSCWPKRSWRDLHGASRLSHR